ncbi:MAG: 2-dehydropantoate 2-reductase [Gemmatimonadales bacterium]
MKICVVGAGAIGGLMGAKLSLAGEEVTLIARGPHLAAIQQHGLKLIMQDGTELVARDAKATSEFDRVGPTDIVILALKAHQIEAVAERIPALFGSETVVVTVQNGIPWWYFHKSGGDLEGTRLESLDPHGVIERHIPYDGVIGSIAYPASEKPEPGVIKHIEGNRFPVAELDNSKSERVKRIAAVFTNAGFKSKVSTDIRSQIWLKAWGNLSFNPISALTRATLEEICTFPATRKLAADMMKEAQEIAEKLDVTFRLTIEQRIEGAERVGAHKTSMLQDVESCRALEIEALIGVIAELGRLTNTATPSIDAVYALTKLLSRGLADLR